MPRRPPAAAPKPDPPAPSPPPPPLFCAQTAGVESNGAGKTALVMAPLWALTGSVDARAEVRCARGQRPHPCNPAVLEP